MQAGGPAASFGAACHAERMHGAIWMPARRDDRRDRRRGYDRLLYKPRGGRHGRFRAEHDASSAADRFAPRSAGTGLATGPRSRMSGGGRSVRRAPVGAEVSPEGVRFRVWAPRPASIAVVAPDGLRVPLAREDGGYFSGTSDGFGAGSRYAFSLDGGAATPDPASRFQPEGPHGPSEVIDPRPRSPGPTTAGAACRRCGQVIYELHVGTFTPEGTCDGGGARSWPTCATSASPCVELMPVADFPGRFGWGYDGVDLFAPTRLYGRPDDLRRFVDTRARLGLGVILDVVYNHLGPDGNYLGALLARRTSPIATHTEWGKALNFDGADAAPVREFFVANAGYWIDEFHLDGLRLDATAADLRRLAASTSWPRSRGACARRRRARSIVLVAENEPQDTRLVAPAEPTAATASTRCGTTTSTTRRVVALTGRNEAYYTDYLGSPQELVSARAAAATCSRASATAGRRSGAARRRSTCAATRFVALPREPRPGRELRARRAPRRADHPGTLARDDRAAAARAGDAACCSRARSSARPRRSSTSPTTDADARARRSREGGASSCRSSRRLADPGDAAGAASPIPATRRRSRAASSTGASASGTSPSWRCTAICCALRRDDPAFRQQRADRVDGAVLGAEAFVLRFRHDGRRSPAAGEPRTRSAARAGAGAAARAAAPDGWTHALGREDVALRRHRHCRPSRRDDGWHLPGHARWSWRLR